MGIAIGSVLSPLLGVAVADAEAATSVVSVVEPLLLPLLLLLLCLLWGLLLGYLGLLGLLLSLLACTTDISIGGLLFWYEEGELMVGFLRSPFFDLAKKLVVRGLGTFRIPGDLRPSGKSEDEAIGQAICSEVSVSGRSVQQ